MLRRGCGPRLERAAPCPPTAPSSHPFPPLHAQIHRYAPDPGLFVSAAYDGLVRAWDADTLQPALDFELHGRAYALHLSPVASSHGLIAVGSEEAAVRLCDLRSGARTHLLHGHTGPVWAVRWSPVHEHALASGSQDGRALVWDVRRPGALHALDRPSPGGARAGAGGAGAERGAQRRRACAHDGGVNGLLFSPEGSELLTFGKDDRLRAWDALGGKFLNVHYEGTANAAPRNVVLAAAACGGAGTAHAHAYVPCGRLLHVYEWATGRLRARLRGHFERVNAVALADGGGAGGGGGGELLLTASDDHSICAWAPPADALGAVAQPAPGRSAPACLRAAHGRGVRAAEAAAAAAAGLRSLGSAGGPRGPAGWEEEGARRGGAGAAAAGAAATVVDADADAWSEDEAG